MRTVIWIFIVLWLSPGMAAEAYKCRGSKGETIFSDQPCPGAEKVELKPVPTYTAPPLPATPATGKADKSSKADKAAAGYTGVEIASPKADEEIHQTEGAVTVTVDLKPALKAGHRLRLEMDGQTVEPVAAQTVWMLSEIERGEHSLQVHVLDEAGKVLKSSGVQRFTLHKRSMLNPAQREQDEKRRKQQRRED